MGLTGLHATHKTVYRLAHKQQHSNYAVPEQPKEGKNIHIELEKHKLDQIAVRNIGIFL